MIKYQIIEVSVDGETWRRRVFIKWRDDGKALCLSEDDGFRLFDKALKEAELVAWPKFRLIRGGKIK